MLLVVCLSFFVYLTARIWRPPGGLGRPNCSASFYFQNPFLMIKRWQTFLELLSFLMIFFSPLFVLTFSISFFVFFRNLLGSILNSQADPPTSKTFIFLRQASHFWKQKMLDPIMVLRAFGGLGSFWKLSGVSWELFGTS